LNSSTKFKSSALGFDMGSSYIKAVCLDHNGSITQKLLEPTGYDFAAGWQKLTHRLHQQKGITGVTGYGRNHVPANTTKTEISALARALVFRGVEGGTLIDIGGQDSKVIKIANKRVVDQIMNRRCAAGTGSYLQFAGQRLNLEAGEMNQIAASEQEYHPLNTFCTVFTATEILDCMNKKIPLSLLVRGLYASIVERIREMTRLEPPLYLSGGVIAYHPVLAELFKLLTDMPVHIVSDPQFVAAQGIALYALEESMEEKEQC